MGRGNGFNSDEDNVLVVDADRQFVEYVSSAVARRALTDGYVSVFRKQPFSIQLLPGVDRCPRTFARARRARKQGNSMAINSSALRNFTEFFKEERDIWVKSLVPGQVSIQFQAGPGSDPIGITVPFSGDPICLTDQVPFEAIKRSTDLRKLCNPRRTSSGGMKPRALELMTSEQVEAHFATKAQRRGLFVQDAQGNFIVDENGDKVPDIEAASRPKITEPATTVAASRVEGVGAQKSAAAMDAHSDVANLGKDGKVMMRDAIHPRVQHLINQIVTAENDAERPDPNDLLDEFEAISGDLTDESLAHIQAMGYFKTIKAWAGGLIEARAAEKE